MKHSDSPPISGDLKFVGTEKLKPQKQWPNFLWLTFAATAVLGCAAASDAEIANEYAIYEMRKDSVSVAFSVTNSDNYLAWLDNARVIFEGYDTPAFDHGGKRFNAEKMAPSRRLFLWDIYTGEVSPHTAEPLRSSMCFVDGFISYAVDRDGATVGMAGAFGSETEVSKPTLTQEFNPFTCNYYQRGNLPPAKFGGFMYPLRTEDGWIERGTGDAWLHTRRGSSKKLYVPTLSWGSVYPHKHSSYAGKYLYYHSNRSRSETWAFSGSGDMELLHFPEGPWGTGAIEPVYVGLLLRSKHVGNKSFWDPGYAGLYIHSSSGVEKLASGNVYALRVSNNGCLIAAFVDPWNSDHRKHRLVAFNICKKSVRHVG